MSRAAICLCVGIASAHISSGISMQEKPVAPAATASPTFVLAWRTPATFSGPPMLAAGPRAVFLATAESGISAFALSDGRELWRSSVKSDVAPVAVGSVVLCRSGSALEALNQENGQSVWRVDLETGDAPLWLDTVGSFGVTVVGRELRAWRPDGTAAWRTALDSFPVTRAVAAASVTIIGMEKAVVALDTESGAIRWRSALDARPVSMAVVGNDLLLGADDRAAYLFHIAPTFEREWRHRAVGTVGSPTANDEMAFFALIDNTLKAYSRAGGTRRWTHRLPSRPLMGPVLIGNMLALPLANGALVHVSAESGKDAPGANKSSAATGRASAAIPAPDGSAIFGLITGDGATNVVAWRISAKPPRP